MKETFLRVASACNLAGAFKDCVTDGSAFTATGKVDYRLFPRLMDKVAFMYGKDCASKYFMLPILLAKFGVKADDFRWRGNATEGIEAHPLAAQFAEWCAEYLRGQFPEYNWEAAAAAPAARRKDIPSDILATLDI